MFELADEAREACRARRVRQSHHCNDAGAACHLGVAPHRRPIALVFPCHANRRGRRMSPRPSGTAPQPSTSVSWGRSRRSQREQSAPAFASDRRGSAPLHRCEHIGAPAQPASTCAAWPRPTTGARDKPPAKGRPRPPVLSASPRPSRERRRNWPRGHQQGRRARSDHRAQTAGAQRLARPRGQPPAAAQKRGRQQIGSAACGRTVNAAAAMPRRRSPPRASTHRTVRHASAACRCSSAASELSRAATAGSTQRRAASARLRRRERLAHAPSTITAVSTDATSPVSASASATASGPGPTGAPAYADASAKQRARVLHLVGLRGAGVDDQRGRRAEAEQLQHEAGERRHRRVLGQRVGGPQRREPGPRVGVELGE